MSNLSLFENINAVERGQQISSVLIKGKKNQLNFYAFVNNCSLDSIDLFCASVVENPKESISVSSQQVDRSYKKNTWRILPTGFISKTCSASANARI